MNEKRKYKRKWRRIKRRFMVLWVFAIIMSTILHWATYFVSSYELPTIPAFRLNEVDYLPKLGKPQPDAHSDRITALTNYVDNLESSEWYKNDIAEEENQIQLAKYRAYLDYCEEYADEIEEDIWYLTCFLYGECRGSGWTLQSCCAWAILNHSGGSSPGHLHTLVTWYKNSWYSSYCTSFKNYNWTRTWTVTYKYSNYYGKTRTLSSKYQTVEEKNPSGWAKEKEIATDVYYRWVRELCGYEDVGRTLPKEYTHFFCDKSYGHGNTFPRYWSKRYDHSYDWVIDVEAGPYDN